MAAFATMMMVALVVVLAMMPSVVVVHHPGTAVRVVHALDGGVRVGSSIYPISASASLGALANVTLSQAGADEPVRINVTYDDTSSFQGAMGAFRVYIAAEPLDRIDAGVTVAECLTLPMYDPNEQAPPFVRLNVYVRRGCDGEADMIMGEDYIPDHNDTQVAAREKSCALGDLSGKHGLLPAPKGTHTFEDRSITNLNDIIGLPFVMVNDESRTVACANIVMDVDDDYKPLFEEPPSETSRIIDRSSSSSQCSIPVPQCTSGQLNEDSPGIISSEPTEVTPNTYPWIVYMGPCSGTLIAPTVVLTAAHCVMPHGPIRMGSVVYIGCHLISQGCQEARLVTDVYAHEKFTDQELYSSETDDGKPRQKFAYDVAVLILDKPSRLSVATLATRDDDPAYCEKSASTVAGWGRDTTGQRSEVLLQVEVPVTSHESCEKVWGKGRIGPTMICAGFDDGGCDACQGDSGGPIFTSTRCAPPDTPPRVFGIVSWGAPCDKAKREPYGVYTSVASVRDWIASKMLEGELADPDESVLPYVVRSIDETVETATDSTLCTLLDDQSRCGEDEVMKLCPKLCGGSCPLVQNVKSTTTITPPQTTTSSSTTTAPPTIITPPQTTTSSSTTTAPPTIMPPQTTSSSTTTAPPQTTTSSSTKMNPKYSREYAMKALDSPDIPIEHAGELPIHRAAQNGNLDDIRALLEVYPEGIRARGTFGFNPLQIASYYGAPLEVVKYLYEAYPEGVKNVSLLGTTPLTSGVYQNAPLDVIQFLYEKYPESVSIRGLFGANPLMGSALDIAKNRERPQEIIDFLESVSNDRALF
ncbi:trypsin [Pseudoscourfieldia marina]